MFFSTEKKNIKETTRLVLKEIDKIKRVSLSKQQLNKFKQQYIGQAIMAEENYSNLMVLLGKEQILYNKVTTIKSFLEELNSIQPSDIQRVAREILKNSRRSEIKI